MINVNIFNYIVSIKCSMVENIDNGDQDINHSVGKPRGKFRKYFYYNFGKELKSFSEIVEQTYTETEDVFNYVQNFLNKIQKTIQLITNYLIKTNIRENINNLTKKNNISKSINRYISKANDIIKKITNINQEKNLEKLREINQEIKTMTMYRYYTGKGLSAKKNLPYSKFHAKISRLTGRILRDIIRKINSDNIDLQSLQPILEQQKEKTKLIKDKCDKFINQLKTNELTTDELKKTENRCKKLNEQTQRNYTIISEIEKAQNQTDLKNIVKTIEKNPNYQYTLNQKKRKTYHNLLFTIKLNKIMSACKLATQNTTEANLQNTTHQLSLQKTNLTNAKYQLDKKIFKLLKKNPNLTQSIQNSQELLTKKINKINQTINTMLNIIQSESTTQEKLVLINTETKNFRHRPEILYLKNIDQSDIDKQNVDQIIKTRRRIDQSLNIQSLNYDQKLNNQQNKMKNPETLSVFSIANNSNNQINNFTAYQMPPYMPQPFLTANNYPNNSNNQINNFTARQMPPYMPQPLTANNYLNNSNHQINNFTAYQIPSYMPQPFLTANNYPNNSNHQMQNPIMTQIQQSQMQNHIMTQIQQSQMQNHIMTQIQQSQMQNPIMAQIQQSQMQNPIMAQIQQSQMQNPIMTQIQQSQMQIIMTQIQNNQMQQAYYNNIKQTKNLK